MTRDEVFEKLNEVFSDVFDDEKIKVNDNTTANDIESWDSLTNISLLVSIENAFKIKFSIDEVKCISNVGEMVNIILGRSAL